MLSEKLIVKGMTCNHCVQTLTKSLKKLPGVDDVEVSLEGKSATVRYDEGQLDVAAIARTIVEAGYEVGGEDEGTTDEDPGSLPAGSPLSAARDSPPKKTDRFKISGMTCATCARTIEKGVRKLEGVSHTAVNFAAEVLTVEYADGALEPLAVEKKVEALGYKARRESGAIEGKLIFLVRGMHCASCAVNIEEKLASVAGVNAVSVNFATERAIVHYDPSQIDRARIFRIVHDLGYLPREKEGETEQEDRKEFYWLLYSIGLTIPILIFIYTDVIGPASTYVLFVLTTVLQFTAGFIFYKGSYHSLKNRSANMDVLIALGISAAYLYSVAVTFFPSAMPSVHTFYETSALLICFVRFGKMLEARAKGRAGRALRKLLELQADRARLVL
ncbi:MAG: copper ion binding protein, partial [Candidatus Hydrogenedentota bacterium]